jgi:hypothetical protein
VTSAIKEVLMYWYDLSPFQVAFADHEAEFDGDPDEWINGKYPFALLAVPSGAKQGPPLFFRDNAWALSPLGA